jgi:hypothetical protein
VPWDSNAFDRLKDEVEASVRGRTPSTGVPFFLYLYEPAEETRCLRACEQLAMALGGLTTVQTVYLGELLAHVLRNTLYLTADGRQAEKRAPERVVRELSRPAGLPAMLTSSLLDGVDGLVSPLRGGSQDRVAVLLRAGALYPFAHVSQLLNGLENQTAWTLVVAFPGSRHPQRPDSLRFLNETEGPYYRARVIG